MIKQFLTVVGILASQTMFARQEPLSVSDSIAVKNYFFAGLSNRLLENYSAAWSNFQQILQLEPNNDAAWYELANLQIRQKQLLDAEISIKKAINRKPANPWYWRMLSDIYKLSGNSQGWLTSLDRLIELEPQQDIWRIDRINILLILNKLVEAEQELKQYEQQFGKTKSSEQAASHLLTLKNPKQPNPMMEQGEKVENYLLLSTQLLAQHKAADALKVLEKAKERRLDNYKLDLAFADVYQALNRMGDAFAALENAFKHPQMPVEDKITLLASLEAKISAVDKLHQVLLLANQLAEQQPQDDRVALLRANILFKLGDYNQARNSYLQTIKLSEQNYQAWEKLLYLELMTNRFAEAVKLGDTALSYYPNQAVLYYYRAFALHRNNQIAEAAFELNNALQLVADDDKLKSMVLALQAEVFIDQGKLSEAESVFDQSVALYPNNYLAQSSYAYYLALKNRNLDKAAKMAAEAARHLPNNTGVLDAFAFVLFRQGQYAEALKVMEKALQNKTVENSVYLEHYGDILYMNGRKEQALQVWKKAQDMGGDNEKLKRKINEKKYIK